MFSSRFFLHSFECVWNLFYNEIPSSGSLSHNIRPISYTYEELRKKHILEISFYDILIYHRNMYKLLV